MKTNFPFGTQLHANGLKNAKTDFRFVIYDLENPQISVYVEIEES